MQTEPLKTCYCYPVYFDFKDKKGNPVSILIGYYDDTYEKFDYNISVPMTTAAKIGWWIFGIGVAAAIAFIVLVDQGIIII